MVNMKQEADQLAGSLAGWLASVSFADRDADQVTDLLIEAVAAWGKASGWRVYRKARSVLPLPPPYSDRHSFVDVGVARGSAAPLVVEVDRSDRKRTLEKLAAEAQSGRVALWVRWGSGPFPVPPLPVRLVPFPVVARRGEAGRRLFATMGQDLPAPAHSGAVLTQAEQADLFSISSSG